MNQLKVYKIRLKTGEGGYLNAEGSSFVPAGACYNNHEVAVRNLKRFVDYYIKEDRRYHNPRFPNLKEEDIEVVCFLLMEATEEVKYTIKGLIK